MKRIGSMVLAAVQQYMDGLTNGHTASCLQTRNNVIWCAKQTATIKSRQPVQDLHVVDVHHQFKVVPDTSTVDASAGNREASFSGTLELGMHCVASSQAQTPPVWM